MASNNKKVSATPSKQNHTVAEIKQQHKKANQIDSQLMFDKAKEALNGVKLRDPNKNTSRSITAYSRETLRGYLQSPASNETNLRNAARYLYYRSPIFSRLIQWYAGMWDLRCRKVTPPFDLNKPMDVKKSIKYYNETLDGLDIYNIHGSFYPVAVRCYLEDVCYSLFFKDETGSMFYILEPDECRIDGKYYTGDFSFAIDMSRWRNQQRQEQIEWIGEPLESMWREYQNSGTKWVHVPDEYAACFKFRSDTPDVVIPPFAALLQQLAGLNDLEDIQAVRDDLSIYKLLIYPIKVMSGVKEINAFEIDPAIALEYFNKMLDDALPEYVSAAMVPGQITQDNVIDFSTTSADKDIDRIQQAQNQILGTAGGGAVINANNITSTAAFNAWLKAETEFALSSLMPQIEGFTNRMLSYDTSNPCKVEYFEVSVYTKEELRKAMLESNQYSYPNRLAYNTLLGIPEKSTLAMLHFENEILGLPDLMQFPLQSSYTQSGDGETGEVGEGAPQKDDSDLTTEGSRSRDRFQ